MKIGHVIVPADDLESQVDFYTDLGLTLRFRDEDRYAAVTDGVTTVGLAGAPEQPVSGRTMLSIQVDDLEATLRRLDDRGTPHGPPVHSDHEIRSVATDPGGNALVIYERRG
jgi:predicted enzyme related to lactoylglutathione lyase